VTDFFFGLFILLAGAGLGYWLRAYIEHSRAQRAFRAWQRSRPFFSSRNSKHE